MGIEVNGAPTTLSVRVPRVESDRHFVAGFAGNRVPRPGRPPVCSGAFSFPLEHVASRLGVSFQYVSKLRWRFVDASIIAQTELAITNRRAGRFSWLL
jgi:hypothetical protein